MVRKAKQQAIDAKMYRHFAAITLLATAALAVATSDGLPEPEPRAQHSKAASKPYGEAKLVRRSSPTANPQPAASGWASDEQIHNPGASSTSYGVASTTAPVEAAETLDLTPEQLALLSPEERERVLQRQAAMRAAADPAERQRQAQRIAEASLRRSGGSE